VECYGGRFLAMERSKSDELLRIEAGIVGEPFMRAVCPGTRQRRPLD